MNSCKLSLAVCSLSAFLALHAVAQSAQPLTAPANAIPSAGARLQSPSGQSETAEDFPRCENAFGSTPETRGKLVTPPTVIHKVQPKYPPPAKKAHIEGMVVLCVTIGKDGNVRSARATSGPKELIPAAVKALEQWRFRPYLANNEPVEASIQIRVNFRLTRIEITLA
jgi:TonB family protein